MNLVQNRLPYNPRTVILLVGIICIFCCIFMYIFSIPRPPKKFRKHHQNSTVWLKVFNFYQHLLLVFSGHKFSGQKNTAGRVKPFDAGGRLNRTLVSMLDLPETAWASALETHTMEASWATHKMMEFPGTRSILRYFSVFWYFQTCKQLESFTTLL